METRDGLPLIDVSARPHYPRPPRRATEVPAWSVLLLVGVLAFGAGFFAGREYLKYEVNSAVDEAMQSFMRD